MNIKSIHEKPASKLSLARRSMLFGVGVNDAPYNVTRVVDGRQITCPAYAKWVSMITRCYDSNYHKRKPTYKSCSVESTWHSFMSFKSWFDEQDSSGKHLDKDILFRGNKIYSPMYCAFVDLETNNLFNGGRKNHLPTGVYFSKSRGVFVSNESISGKSAYIGSFDSPGEAHIAWAKRKAIAVRKCAEPQSDSRVKIALITRAIELEQMQ